MKKITLIRNFIYLLLVIEWITISIITTNKLIDLKNRVVKLESQIVELEKGR